MVFIRTLQSGDIHSECRLYENGSEKLVIVGIGYDDQEPLNYTLVAGFSPMAGGDMEYFFHVVEANEETGEAYPHYSGKDTRFLKGDDRQAVLEALLAATRCLLDSRLPKRVFRITYDENPPDKALGKHYLVAQVFEEYGYKVTIADPWHGHRAWWMELTPL